MYTDQELIALADIIRIRYQTNQLGVCRDVSADIERELGLKQVKGLFDGVHPHCWNLLADGRVLDATANQFGLAPVVLTDDHTRYVEFTEQHIEFIRKFQEENYGRYPDMEDFLFMDMDDEDYEDDEDDEAPIDLGDDDLGF